MLGDASFGRVNIAGFAPSDSDGATVQVRAVGTLNNVPEQYLGSVVATKSGSDTILSFDRTPLGANTSVVSVYDGPKLVKVGVDVANPTVRLPGGNWLCTPILASGPGSISTRIDLSELAFVLAIDNQPVKADRIEITMFDPMHLNQTDVSTVSRLEMLGAGLNSFRILGEELGKFQRRHQAIGGARLLAVGDLLRVDNLPTPAIPPRTAGVRFLLNDSDTFSAFWKQLDRFGEVPPGTMLRASLEGRTNGGGESLLGFTEITSLGVQKEIAADFSAAGVSSRLVDVLRGNVVLFSTTLGGAAGLVARTAEWPDGVRTERSIPVFPDIVRISWRWIAPVAIEVASRTYLADELRVSLEVAGGPILLSSLSLQASGFAQIDLVADIAHSSAPVTATARTIGGVLLIEWDVANPGQVLQGADAIDGTWADIPGATSSPYVVPTIGSKKFIRVKTALPAVP